MRQEQRRRHEIGPFGLRFLKPFFCYSWARDAWILKGIGERRGPVFVLRERD